MAVAQTNQGSQSGPALPGALYNPNPASMAASFASTEMGDLTQLNQSYKDLFDPASMDTSVEQQRQLQEQQIQGSYGDAMKELQAVQQSGKQQLSRAMELLQLSPTASLEKINEFNSMANQFNTSMAAQINSLTRDENIAIEQNNLDAANQIRQAKLDAFNAQRQMLTDRWNIVSNAFNMMLSGQQAQAQLQANEQTTATNQLNWALQAFGGKSLSEIPADAQAGIQNAALTLGMSPSEVNDLLRNSGPATKIVAHGDYIYAVDSAGNVLNRTYAPAASGGSSVDPNLAIAAYRDGDVMSLTSKTAPIVESWIQQQRSDVIGDLVWQQRDVAYNTLLKNGNPAQETVSTLVDNVKINAINSVISQLKDSPQTLSALLGKTLMPGYKLTEGTADYQRVYNAVAARVDSLISSDYLHNVIAKANQPYLNTLLMDTSGQNTSDDTQMGF